MMELLKNFTMNDKVYDALKFIVVIVSPALVTLIVTLGELYGFDSAKICGTISALAVFAGSVLQISSANYKKANTKKEENIE